MQPHRGGSATNVAGRCHDRYGYLEANDFGRRACTLCYIYLFPSQWPKYVAVMPDNIYLMAVTDVGDTNNETGNVVSDPRLYDADAAVLMVSFRQLSQVDLQQKLQ